VILVLLLGVRPLIKALRSPRAPALDESEGSEAALGVEGPRPAAALAPPVSPERLVEQVSLAQRIALERPDDAVQALREMLSPTPEPEGAA
jgi:flagellar M-ring protein FliF